MSPKFLARLSQALHKNKAASADSLDANKHASKSDIGPGALINERYRLDAEIGRGGMGIVYRAHDIPNDREVAIKVINLDEANELTRQQFSREAEIALSLKHPHIVEVYETDMVNTGVNELSPFIVMELVQGRRLSDLHDFTYSRIINIASQICEALAYAHDKGFIHRDIKPGNVFIEKHGFEYVAKLMDFGLARARGAVNSSNESNLAGTVYYLAPEVIAGRPADIGSDLYALGAMLYEMVTGRVPFSDFLDEQTIITQHLEATVTPPSQSRGDMPHALESIILRLLAKNPGDRFSSAEEVHQALEQIVITPESNIPYGNLPTSSTDYTGNGDDLLLVKQMLGSNQLVTLLGDGKTLALTVGTQLTVQFPDGVWQIELEALDSPALVVPIVASALGVREDPRRALTVLLIEYLREKNLLLILNHCDHLLSACAQLAEIILRNCPDVYILTTSDQPLNIANERCYPIPFDPLQ